MSHKEVHNIPPCINRPDGMPLCCDSSEILKLLCACRISREIGNSNEDDRDFDLNDSFFLLLGTGDRQAAGAINTHEFNVLPQVSAGQVNPATGKAVFGDNTDIVTQVSTGQVNPTNGTAVFEGNTDTVTQVSTRQANPTNGTAMFEGNTDIVTQVSTGQVNPTTGPAVIEGNTDIVTQVSTRHVNSTTGTAVFGGNTNIATQVSAGQVNLATGTTVAIGLIFTFVAQINHPIPGLIDLGGDSEITVCMLIY